LSESLKGGHLHLWDLAEVQRQREWPTRIIQWFQALAQQNLIKNALNSNQQFTLPAILYLPIVRNLIARFVAFGVGSAHLNT
jgi:hypothetical protein